MQVLETASATLDWIEPRISKDKYQLIGIDGLDGVGKSPLARYLALHLRTSLVELDLFQDYEQGFPHYRWPDLSNLFTSAKRSQWPLIAEGSFLCHVVKRLELEVTELLYVKHMSRHGIWAQGLCLDELDSDLSQSLSTCSYSEPLFHRLGLYHREYEPTKIATGMVEWRTFTITS